MFRLKLFLIFVVVWVNGAYAQNDSTFEICSIISEHERPYIVQGVDNWLFGRNELVTDIDIASETYQRIQELKKALDFVGIEVIVANLPHRSMMHFDKFDLSEPLLQEYNVQLAIQSYNESIQELQALGFEAPNVLEHLNQKSVADFGFKRDSHWTPEAAHSTARAIKNIFNNLTVDTQLRYTDFDVQLKEIVQRNSDLARYVSNACGFVYPTEPQKTYEIVQPGEVKGLFEATSTSNVALWGTSYSRSSNFAEFLQAELDVEVHNYGFNVAGLWRSLRHYFLKNGDSNQHPEVVIWEFPFGYYEEFNQLDTYKEIIPTIYGICGEGLDATPRTSVTIANPINLLGESNNLFSEANWLAMRSMIFPYETTTVDTSSRLESVVQLVFNGQNDPWIFRQVETNENLSGKEYEFSVWLWTDEEQPKDAAIYVYNGADITIQKITLTDTPTEYLVKHQFADTENTAYSIRIDGLESQIDELNPKHRDSYLYAAQPRIYKRQPSIELLRNQTESIRNNDYYTYIRFDDRSIVDYDLLYGYADGTTIRQSISRDKYSRNNGKYFYELPHIESESYIESITIDGLVAKSYGGISTQICRKP